MAFFYRMYRSVLNSPAGNAFTSSASPCGGGGTASAVTERGCKTLRHCASAGIPSQSCPLGNPAPPWGEPWGSGASGEPFRIAGNFATSQKASPPLGATNATAASGRGGEHLLAQPSGFRLQANSAARKPAHGKSRWHGVSRDGEGMQNVATLRFRRYPLSVLPFGQSSSPVGGALGGP